MRAHQKTKLIQKQLRRAKKRQVPVEEQKIGEPELKSLSDFVTALTPTYTSRPIYTGGRIVISQGKIFASCNQEISVYELSMRTSLPRIKVANQQLVNFAVNLAGTRIATYSENGLFRIMDLSTQKVLQIIRLSNKLFPNDIAFSPDSKYIAVGFASQLVKIFTVESLKQTHSYQHSAPVRKVQWHPNAQLIQVISSDDNSKIVVFDYIANKMVGQVDGGHTFCLDVSGKRLISVKGQEIRLYETKGLKLLQSFNSEHYIETLYLVGQVVLFGGEQTPLLAWKIGEENVKPIKSGTDKGVMKILGWQKQKKCIVISAEQNLTILDTVRFTPQDVIVGFNDEVIDIKYSKSNPSDYFLLITNSTNAKIMNRHTNSLHFLLQGHSDIILCGEYWHPWIATAGKDKVIKLWKINEAGRPKLVANYSGHSDDVCGLGWLPKSHILVSVGEDKTIKLWSLCEAGPDVIQIHSALSTIMGHQKTINTVRVSPKDELIATCSHDRSVKIWDKTLTNLFTLTGHKRGVWDAAFHSKEALLVTAGGDGMLKGWSMIDGSCVWSMGEGAGLVRCQWIYEHQVVTGSVDGILKIWDVRKMTSLSYDKHQGKIWALEVRKNQNGKCEVATGANDSVYQIWGDSTEETRAKILKQGQIEQKERVLLDQYRYDKQYLQAAKVAFEGNYSQMFVEVVEEMVGGIVEDRIIAMDEEGKIIEQPKYIDNHQISLDLSELIRFACQTDINRLLGLVLKMNSTVRHFKTANKLLLQILRQKKIKGLMPLDRSFVLPVIKQEYDQKQTDFQKFLKNMQIYTEKHYNRIEKYIRASYWIDHVHDLQNPMTL